MSLTKRRIGWAFLAINAPQVSQTLTSLVVAPFLRPQDLGLVTLAAGIILFFEQLRDSGINEALLREKDPSPSLFNTAGIYFLLVGFFMALLLWPLAPLLAHLLSSPELESPLRVLSLLLPLESFSRVGNTYLLRHFAYRRLFFLQIIPLLLSLPATLYWASRGLGFWSLIWGGLLASLIRNVLFLSVWRPRREFSLSELRRLLSFGVHILWQFFLNWGYLNGLRLLIGKFLGTGVLGLVSLAVSLSLRPLSFLSLPLTRMALPLLAEAREEPERFRKIYRRFLLAGLVTALLLAIFLCLAWPPLIPRIFGPQWQGAGEIISVFAWVGALQSLSWFTPEVLKALGRPHFISRYFTCQVILALTLYAYLIPRGLWSFLKGFALFESAGALLTLALAWWTIQKSFDQSLRKRQS